MKYFVVFFTSLTIMKFHCATGQFCSSFSSIIFPTCSPKKLWHFSFIPQSLTRPPYTSSSSTLSPIFNLDMIPFSLAISLLSAFFDASFVISLTLDA